MASLAEEFAASLRGVANALDSTKPRIPYCPNVPMLVSALRSAALTIKGGASRGQEELLITLQNKLFYLRQVEVPSVAQPAKRAYELSRQLIDKLP